MDASLMAVLRPQTQMKLPRGTQAAPSPARWEVGWGPEIVFSAQSGHELTGGQVQAEVHAPTRTHTHPHRSQTGRSFPHLKPVHTWLTPTVTAWNRAPAAHLQSGTITPDPYPTPPERARLLRQR